MTDRKQPQICLCQKVCSVYQDGFKLSHHICPLVGCESRTSHSSASEPERLCDDCNIIELEEKVMELELQVKQERVEVLDEANLIFIRVVDDIAENGDANWHKCDMLDKMQSVWCEVESLRQQEQKP